MINEIKKDPRNKGRLSLIERIRSIWQGSVFWNITFKKCEQLTVEELNCLLRDAVENLN